MSKVFEFRSGRFNLERDWKEIVGTSAFNAPMAPSHHYDDADESLLCNFQSIFGDPGRDALMLGQVPEASAEFRGLCGRLSTADESLATLRPLNKKLRCTDGSFSQLHRTDSSAAASGWKLVVEDTALEPQHSPFQPDVISAKHNQGRLCHVPITLPYGDPPQSFLSTISSFDPFSDHSQHLNCQVPYLTFQLPDQELYECSFSTPSESETHSSERISKNEAPAKATTCTKPSRRPTRAVMNSRRSPNRSKGVTMCLRTLLRQLLAGTGWIMDSSISKDQATRLIKCLIGKELDSKLNIELSPERAEKMTPENKEQHFARILPELITLYTGEVVSLEESQEYIKRDKGPYHLTPEFVELLQNRPWPPVLECDTDLRNFGCYRQGEASKRARTSSSDSAAYSIA